MNKMFVLLPVVVALTGCGSMKMASNFEVENRSVLSTAPKAGDVVNLPAWYTATTNDEDALTSAASEFSTDMQFAVDKAMLSAKRELASNYSSHISSMMKDYSAEVGTLNADVVREIDRTTKLIVAQVNLIGVKRTNLEIRHEKSGYRAFVAVRYSTDESNKILMNEIKKNRQLNHKVSASKAFRELEDQVSRVNTPVPVAAAPVAVAPVAVVQPRPVTIRERIGGSDAAVSDEPVADNR
jgi:hypothetical protein